MQMAKQCRVGQIQPFVLFEPAAKLYGRQAALPAGRGILQQGKHLGANRFSLQSPRPTALPAICNRVDPALVETTDTLLQSKFALPVMGLNRVKSRL